MKETEFEIQATVEDLWKLEILAGAAQVSKETLAASILHKYVTGQLKPVN